MQTDKHTKGWDPMYSFCPPVSRGSTGASTAIIDSYPLPTVSSTNAIIGRWLAYFLVLLHTFSYNSQYLYKPQHTFVNYLLEWLIPLPWTRTPRGCNNWLYYGLPWQVPCQCPIWNRNLVEISTIWQHREQILFCLKLNYCWVGGSSSYVVNMCKFS